MLHRRAVMVVAILLACSGPAWSGAFLQPDGKGQIIVTGTFSAATTAFDEDGKVAPAHARLKLELDALVEYGLNGWMTLFAKPSVMAGGVYSPVPAYANGAGQTEMGARLRLLATSDGAGVISLQSALRFPGQRDSSNPAKGETDLQADLRLLGGYGFSYRGWSGFGDAQVGYRARLGDAADEMHLDLTIGLRPRPRVLLMMQSFNTMSLGSGRNGYPDTRYHKLQTSVVYDLTEAWSVQFGAIATIGGKNALEESGVLAGVWRRF